MQRFLDPAVLAGISSLDLVAKTVVDGFVAGLHRSPDFGFSQEFAEYRAYTPGDDLRHVDWNLFARTERTVSEAVSRRDEQPADDAAGCEQLDEVYFGERSDECVRSRARWTMRGLWRRRCSIWRSIISAIRRG